MSNTKNGTIQENQVYGKITNKKLKIFDNIETSKSN